VHIGGAVMWVGGSAIMFVLIMVTFLAWSRQGQRASSRGWLEAARRASLEYLTTADAPQPTAGAASAPSGTAAATGSGAGARSVAARADIDEDDDQLAAYNAFLARLNRGGHESQRQ
jgi:putative copper resistance protein D